MGVFTAESLLSLSDVSLMQIGVPSDVVQALRLLYLKQIQPSRKSVMSSPFLMKALELQKNNKTKILESVMHSQPLSNKEKTAKLASMFKTKRRIAISPENKLNAMKRIKTDKGKLEKFLPSSVQTSF